MEMYPAFSPDGNWLAYWSNETGQGEVHVRPYPAGEPAYQVSNSGGLLSSPVWSPDGRQLFYSVLAGDGVTRFMVVDVDTESTFTRSRPRALFEGRYLDTGPIRGYDISPDGERFVMKTEVPRDPETVTSINVVLNWVEELKRLVPVP